MKKAVWVCLAVFCSVMIGMTVFPSDDTWDPGWNIRYSGSEGEFIGYLTEFTERFPITDESLFEYEDRMYLDYRPAVIPEIEGFSYQNCYFFYELSSPFRENDGTVNGAVRYIDYNLFNEANYDSVSVTVYYISGGVDVSETERRLKLENYRLGGEDYEVDIIEGVHRGIPYCGYNYFHATYGICSRCYLTFGGYFIYVHSHDAFSESLIDRISLRETGVTVPVILLYGAETEESDGAVEARIYTVAKGDCLWNISKELYGSGSRYAEIYGLNRDVIADPDLIYPGQVLVLPE